MRRLISGAVVSVVGVVAYTVGLVDGSIRWVGVGALATFVGVFMLGPLIARPMSRVLGAPIAATAGVAGSLARQNAMRNPKRTSRTGGALMVGVALVAADDAKGRSHGLIINSLTSVSLHPPIMLWCLANTSRAFEVFTKAQAFSVNILRSGDEDVAKEFSRRGDRILTEDQVIRMETGAPVLKDAVASLEAALKLVRAQKEKEEQAENQQKRDELKGEYEKLAKAQDALLDRTRLVAAETDDETAVAKLYQQVLARKPTPKEIDIARQHLASVSDRKTGYEDLLWSMVNSAEFLSRR